MDSDSTALKFLFIGGVPRSGTTALLDLLNSDERMIIGRERFKKIRRKVNPNHFKKERFFSPVKEETNILNVKAYYAPLRDRYTSGNLEYIGDKDPGYANHLDYLVENFPDCKILVLYRDLFSVASSFNVRAANPKDGWPEENDYAAALKYWEAGNSSILRFAKGDHADQLFIVRYESFFAGSEDYLSNLYEFLGVSITDSVREAFKDTTEVWKSLQDKPLNLTDEMREYLEATRDQSLVDAFDELCPPA